MYMKTNMKVNKHKWTELEDVVVCLAYKLKKEGIDTDLKYLSKVTGIVESSLKTKLRNFDYLSGDGKLSHNSKQARKVFKELN